jgi:uncharacterized protein YcsI (UPF0317 family)
MVEISPLRTGADVRAAARTGALTGVTAGLAPGYVQANLVMMPAAYALEFLAFCIRNPKPCPVLEVCEPGDPEPRRLAPGADLRTDLPAYRVYRDGRLVERRTDVTELWTDDMVSILIGCSFTFEWALSQHGIRLAHIEQGRNVSMYITNRECVPAGRFHGPMVVSMRPFPPDVVPQVAAITERFPGMHGAPVWIGDPKGLGIEDLGRPDFGDVLDFGPGDVPVFWACGVTPQAVALASGVPLMITHDPGHMFVTDAPHAAYQV